MISNNFTVCYKELYRERAVLPLLRSDFWSKCEQEEVRLSSQRMCVNWNSRQAKWSCCLLIKRSQMKGVTFTYHWKKYSWYYATGCTLPKDEHILVEFLVIAVQMYWVHYKKVYWSMFYMKILLQSCNSVLLKSVFLSTFKRVLVFKVNLCCTSVILKA